MNLLNLYSIDTLDITNTLLAKSMDIFLDAISVLSFILVRFDLTCMLKVLSAVLRITCITFSSLITNTAAQILTRLERTVDILQFSSIVIERWILRDQGKMKRCSSAFAFDGRARCR